MVEFIFTLQLHWISYSIRERLSPITRAALDLIQYNQSNLNDSGSFWTLMLERIQRSFRKLSIILISLEKIQRTTRMARIAGSNKNFSCMDHG
jgi:hypothetical protein